MQCGISYHTVQCIISYHKARCIIVYHHVQCIISYIGPSATKSQPPYKTTSFVKLKILFPACFSRQGRPTPARGCPSRHNHPKQTDSSPPPPTRLLSLSSNFTRRGTSIAVVEQPGLQVPSPTRGTAPAASCRYPAVSGDWEQASLSSRLCSNSSMYHNSYECLAIVDPPYTITPTGMYGYLAIVVIFDRVPDE